MKGGGGAAKEKGHASDTRLCFLHTGQFIKIIKALKVEATIKHDRETL